MKEKYPDLTKVEGSVAEILTNHFHRINEAFEDEEISDKEFKELVVGCIEQAKPMPSQRRILQTVYAKNGRIDLLQYITNVWLKAQKMGVECE